MENKYVTVSAINRYISYKFTKDIHLHEVYLKGEVSNFKYSKNHCYFSLKDETSEIGATFFYPRNISLNFEPKDGMSVLVKGEIKVYEKKGTYAINVFEMKQDGLGNLYLQFLMLKEKLQNEGLFDEDKKLKVPLYPEKIAIITAKTGEAINDIVSTFNRRFPLAKLRLYPSLVQGSDAPKDLIRALKLVENDNWADVLIIGRGGGSFEDLSCFNDESLVRFLSAMKIPTVSAVGHEGDFTICDFVCSYRAPTPTGAAMYLTKDKNDLLSDVHQKINRLKNAIVNSINSRYKEFQNLKNCHVLAHFDKHIEQMNIRFYNLESKLDSFNPLKVLSEWELKFSNLYSHLTKAVAKVLDEKEANYVLLDTKLTPKLFLYNVERLEREVDSLVERSILLNPFNVMLKGYSLTLQDGEIIKSIKDLDKEKMLEVRMHDGIVNATINELIYKGEKDER